MGLSAGKYRFINNFHTLFVQVLSMCSIRGHSANLISVFEEKWKQLLILVFFVWLVNIERNDVNIPKWQISIPKAAHSNERNYRHLSVALQDQSIWYPYWLSAELWLLCDKSEIKQMFNSLWEWQWNIS